MNIYTYITKAGKDLILDYLDSLSVEEKAEGYYILEKLESGSILDLRTLNVKHFIDKIWEIKFRKHNRIFYILKEDESIYLLHACKKQKNSTELTDRNMVIKRTKEIV